MKLMRNKNNMYKKLKQQNFSDLELYNKYKVIKNEVNKTIKKAKRDYVANEFIKSENNPRKFWQTLNYAVKNNSGNDKNSYIQTITDENNAQLIDAKEIANHLNLCFATREKSKKKY